MPEKYRSLILDKVLATLAKIQTDAFKLYPAENEPTQKEDQDEVPGAH